MTRRKFGAAALLLVFLMLTVLPQTACSRSEPVGQPVPSAKSDVSPTEETESIAREETETATVPIPEEIGGTDDGPAADEKDENAEKAQVGPEAGAAAEEEAAENGGADPAWEAEEAAEEDAPGNSYIILPRFRGLTETEAVRLLDEAGITCTVEYGYSSVRAGRVRSLRFRGTSDNDSYYIRPGTAVTLSVSLGPKELPSRRTNPTSPDDMRVYLTIDDGPSPAYNQEVLDILAAHGVRATFFLVGVYVRAYPTLAQNIAAGGHVIGCHSYTHDFTPLYGTDEGLQNEVNDWEKAVAAALGSVPDVRLFRYPGGSASAAKRSGEARYRAGQEFLAQKGYLAFDWAMSNNDAWVNSRRGDLTHEEYLKASVLEQLDWLEGFPGRPKIILIHETNRHTVAMLDWMIDLLTGRGFTFGTLDEFSAGYYQ